MLKWLRRALSAAPTHQEPSQQLRELQDEVSDLQRAVKALSFEWTEMYEKFSTLHARLAKRAKREEEGAEGSERGGAPMSQAELLARARQRYGTFTIGRAG